MTPAKKKEAGTYPSTAGIRSKRNEQEKVVCPLIAEHFMGIVRSQ